ncbi:MAG TPA: class I SAM-dependent methyltransferase [Candidatus Binatia bacterium]
MTKQSLKLKENWRHWTPEFAKIFLRDGPEGKTHPSRMKVLDLLEGLSSVLDVGCGNGVMFEMIREKDLDLDYLGVDVTEKLLQVARELFPADAHRFRHMSLYELRKFPRRFDAVVCRHVLEHLPDYVPAVEYLYSHTRKKLILVFFLPPKPLSSGHKRDEKYERDFYNHTYDLGAFVHYLSTELSPAPSEIRIHLGQGKSDPWMPWADRENVIYEVIRPDQRRHLRTTKRSHAGKRRRKNRLDAFRR